MTRETRNNLIFLAVILALLAPGAVILFRKKMQPTLRPMHLPHAVQREVAYLSPLETPPGKQRVEPPHTAKWVESLVRERIGGGRKIVRPQDAGGLPLMSDKKTFQLVALDGSTGASRAWVILWQPDPTRPGEKWSLRDGAGAAEVPVVSSATIDVPLWVREELGETGVVRPPHRIVWQELDLGQIADGSAGLQDGSGDFVNFVPSFTSNARTGN